MAIKDRDVQSLNEFQFLLFLFFFQFQNELARTRISIQTKFIMSRVVICAKCAYLMRFVSGDFCHPKRESLQQCHNCRENPMN